MVKSILDLDSNRSVFEYCFDLPEAVFSYVKWGLY